MINYSFLKTLNILYLENDIKIKKDFLEKVKDLFNTIVSVSNTKEVIDKFLENKNNSFFVDVVIYDIDIPIHEGIDGIKILEKIREVNPAIPIILTTNNSDPKTLLEAIKYNVTDYLPKDVAKRELIGSIQKVTKNRYQDKFKEEMEEVLDELVSAINNVALVSKCDLSGNITFVNKHFCDTSGFTKKEIIGENYNLINGKSQDSEEMKDLWRKIKLGKVWEGKMRNISKTKEVFFTYLTVIPIFNPLNNSIKEYMWIMFLSTEEEIEQSNFKKKVVQNMHSSRRINLEAREKIDNLFKELDRCKNIEFIKYALIEEKKRTSKFISQIAFYNKEIKTKEENINELSKKASIKIKKVVETEKNAKAKRDKTLTTLNGLLEELDLKNKDIKSLNKELDNQIMIIEELEVLINKKERKLNL